MMMVNEIVLHWRQASEVSLLAHGAAFVKAETFPLSLSLSLCISERKKSMYWALKKSLRQLNIIHYSI